MRTHQDETNDTKLNEDLFERVDNAPDDRDYLVTVSYLELYNETIFDLLNIAKDSKDKEGLKGTLNVSKY